MSVFWPSHQEVMDFFNTNIIRRHDDIMMLNSWQVDHLNFIAGFPWLNDDERESIRDEMHQYLCYDV